MYIENPDLGYYHSGTLLYQMLGATYLGDGNPDTTGNVSSVAGQPGTFVEGMNYNYMYKQPPDNYIDLIGSNGGTILFRCQAGHGRVICWGGATNSYRSIYSTFIFGALRNGTNTKLQLLTEYMEYLVVTGVAEKPGKNKIEGLSLSPNPASSRINCSFALRNSQQVKIKIYDMAGRLVCELLDKRLDSGSHQVFWNGCDAQGNKVSSGTYIFVIESEHITLMETVVLVR